MGVKYVLSEPLPPSWWAKNKAAVAAVAGLAIGFYLAGGCDAGSGSTPHHPSPSPSITQPRSPSPKES
ncbi:hypothetical protein GTY65_31370 [Streptomyces sp. SID8379]|uniref:hypothetical protein n=1 Tax=unclassified Streptomyces TaxID=2593676 RepID=UPI0003682570|nr:MULTISPECIES: hypothetical protein [unclassified Streptomyces]MYW68545.1 hypothetical protein [Streptomyces sp. SID8379]